MTDSEWSPFFHPKEHGLVHAQSAIIRGEVEIDLDSGEEVLLEEAGKTEEPELEVEE